MTRYSFSAIRILSLAVLLALAMGGWKTTPAFADGETPPPPDEGTTDLTDGVATEGPAPTDVTSTEVAPVPTEAITEEAAAPVITTDAASTEIAIDSAPVEGEVPEPAPAESEETIDLLAELPEGTELVVVNAEGESVPQASEEASAIIAGGDPIWCPSGVAPKPLVGGCSNTYGSLDQLVAFFTPPSSGTIWFEHGSVDAGTRINGGLFENWEAARNFSLTLQGGWSGAYGSTALDPVDPYTYFDGLNFDYIWITNWVGAVTLKNLVFNAATYDVDFADYVVYVETAGNIKLDKVTVNDGQNDHVNWATYGAYLDNTSGTGSVTVTNSSFNNNEADGLRALSNGTITLKNVFANNNGYRGATLDNTSATTAKSATISNFISNGNGVGGLVVNSSGTVTLNNISAGNNSWIGAYVENDYFGIYPVYVNGVNNFSTNTGHGLQVVSNGAIKVSKTTAIDNSGDGAHLDNGGSSGYQPITIAGFFTAIGNDGDGLEILSRGNVTAAYLTANNNGVHGVTINNTYAGIPKSVTIAGYNVFNDNEGDGFYEGNGLGIESLGSIVLYNLSASNNGRDGVSLYNTGCNSQYPVSIYGVNIFSGNGRNGLYLFSHGSVTLNNVIAVENGLVSLGNGVEVHNINMCLGSVFYPKPVVVKGTNTFLSNNDTGIYVDSAGAISVSNVTANKNGFGGAFLYNRFLDFLSQNYPTTAPVTINGYGVFEYNGYVGGYNQSGLTIKTHGSVTLANINANYNYGSGVNIDTIGVSATHSVTLNGTNTFIGNGTDGTESGLVVNADGTIKVNNLTAMSNHYYGAYLDNYTNWAENGFSYPGSVLVTGFGYFSANGVGLYVDTHKSVTLNRITANGNFAGMDISADGNVTLVCSSAWGNLFTAVAIDTPGVITLKGLLTYLNGTNESFTSYTSLLRSTCP
jgi:hypothetical protein